VTHREGPAAGDRKASRGRASGKIPAHIATHPKDQLVRILATADVLLSPEDEAVRRRGMEIWRRGKESLTMSNLVKAQSLDVALNEEINEMGGSGFGVLLRFDANTKKYSIVGGDEVPIGRQYIAHVDQYARGFVKFVDKRVEGVKIVRLVDGPQPERCDLGDLELMNKPEDCWIFQRYVPMEDLETGELHTFVGKSVGSKIAIGNLLETFKLNYAHRGLPIVALGIGTFKTRDYGERARPDFKIQDWTGPKTLPTHRSDGPPPDDPSDPGYDLDILPER
jgi:hypothetical protein